jgi:hypothetical protein
VRSLKVPGVIVFILATVWIAGWERRLTSAADRGVYPALPAATRAMQELARVEADARWVADGE